VLTIRLHSARVCVAVLARRISSCGVALTACVCVRACACACVMRAQVLLAWPTLLLMVGPAGDWIKYSYDEPTYLVRACVCVCVHVRVLA
jgi:hypothetical protein